MVNLLASLCSCHGFDAGGVVSRFLLTCLVAWGLWAGAGLTLQDPAAEGQEGVSAASETPPSAYVRLDSWAGRLQGWTPALLADLAFILNESPSHGLPDQGPIADNLLDSGLAFADRAELAGLAALRYAGWLEYGLMEGEVHGARGLHADEAAFLVSRLQDGLDAHDLFSVFAERQPQVRDYAALRAEMLRVLALRPIWPEIAPGSSLR